MDLQFVHSETASAESLSRASSAETCGTTLCVDGCTIRHCPLWAVKTPRQMTQAPATTLPWSRHASPEAPPPSALARIGKVVRN